MSEGLITTYMNPRRCLCPFAGLRTPGRGPSAGPSTGFLAMVSRSVVLVTDIGCIGLADGYFCTNAFHGLHGRSVTYATGSSWRIPICT